MIDKPFAVPDTGADDPRPDRAATTSTQIVGDQHGEADPEDSTVDLSAVIRPGADADLANLPTCEIALSTCRTLNKPLEIIWACEAGAGLSLIDRKLFNCLLYYATENVKIRSIDGPLLFKARTRDLRKDMGLKKSTNNEQLRKSLRRLSKEPLDIPTIQGGNFEAPAAATLIEAFLLENGSRVVCWSFPSWLKLDPSYYRMWGGLNIDSCAQFRSKHALRLYELMCTLVNRTHSRDTFSVGYLRHFLGIKGLEHSQSCSTRRSSEKLSSWDALRRRALEPAIDEINHYAHFTVAMTPRRGFCGRRIEKVSFVVSKKRSVR